VLGLGMTASRWYVTSTKFLDCIVRSKGLEVRVVTAFEAGARVPAAGRVGCKHSPDAYSRPQRWWLASSEEG
jgi:hypothetical protein